MVKISYTFKLKAKYFASATLQPFPLHLDTRPSEADPVACEKVGQAVSLLGCF